MILSEDLVNSKPESSPRSPKETKYQRIDSKMITDMTNNLRDSHPSPSDESKTALNG